jgi:tetratricopeptide (TPR) repeat protein
MTEALKALEKFLGYPFPIAFVLKTEVLEAKTPKEQVDGLIRLAETALQYATLIVVSDYACAEFKDERVSHRLERLRFRPLTSDFANFLCDAVPILEKHNALFVPELAEAIKKAQQKEVRLMRMGERGLEEQKQSNSLVKALVNLRNAVTHRGWLGQWEAFIEHHAPLVADFLHLMAWCERYPLLRLLSSGQCLRLMGAETTFTPEPIPNAALEELARAQRAGELTGLLLADPSLSRFRTLYPFLLWTDCPYCQQEPLLGLTEEVFLFSGEEGKRYVAYLGVMHSRPMSEPKTRVSEIFEAKWVQPEIREVEKLVKDMKLYPTLYERARAQSELWLSENIRARRYIPQVYFPRKAMEGELETYLKGSKSGFLLLGESGIGKTNLLCHKVGEWRERGEIVLFYAGHQLNPDEPMEQRLLSDLYLQGDFIRLLEFVRREGRRFIVVVDGVNEHPQSAKLLKCLCEFVQRYGRNFPLKVILSVRSVFFTRMLQALGEGRSEEQLKSLEAGLFPSTIFQTHAVEREGRREETHRFELEAVDEDEVREIYESYRAFDGYWTEEGQLRRFRPTTPYESLTPQVRQVLRHPWLLRMVMEAYDGKPVPERLWTGDILNAFCETKIFGRTDEERERFAPRSQLVTELVRLMRKLKRDNFLRDELHDFSAEWSKALLERELTRSPYLQLLDEGVLMETPITEEWGRFRRIVGYQVRFAFEPLFEFLLSNELLAEGGGWKGLTGEKVAGWLSEGREFDHLTGAVTLLLTEAVQKGNLSLVAETLNAADIELARPVIIEVLTTLEGLKDERFEPLLDELAKKANGKKALTVLIDASYQFGIKLRLHSALACTERAERLARHLVEEEGQKELANYLARALVNKGNALWVLGRPKEAIDCYSEAIGIYRRSVEVKGRAELVDFLVLVMTLMNMGDVLRQMGYLDEALECSEKAIGVYRHLVEVERGVELANYLARALMNKGVVLWALGRLKEAIDCYDEAIGIFKHLVEVEKKAELVDFLAMALINKGNALLYLGRLKEAIDCYDEAMIYRRLVEVEGRMELANYLAMALINKGETLRQMGCLDKALECLEEAIGIYRRLVEVEGRAELADYLAMALINKGVALRDFGRYSEALQCYDEGIGLWEMMMVEGKVHVAPLLIRGLGNRFELKRQMGDWDGAADDVRKALACVMPFLSSGSLTEALAMEFDEFLQRLRQLKEEEWTALASALGEDAELVRQLMQLWSEDAGG